jgi:predicted esterase
MKKNIITTEKTARYFTLGNFSPEVKTVLFVCHGYAQLGDEFISQFSKLENQNTLIVAPEGLHRFYLRGGQEKVVASWMTKEDRDDDIRDYVLFLDKVYDAVLEKFSSPPKIIALGFSQGAATASRWCAMGKSKMDELILWCGFFPPDLPPNGISEKIKLTVVTATKDKFISAEQERNQLEKMKLLSPQLNHVTFEGEHEMNIEILSELISE